MAPSLEASGFGKSWTTDLNRDAEPELILAYNVKIASNPNDLQFADRYAAFFIFRWKDGDYRVASASWFLEGHLHSVSDFAPGSSELKLAVSVASCTECHPWIHLVLLDFGNKADGEMFQFSYEETAPDSWSPGLEYQLPGMGHSIEAKVETRIVEGTSATGPHLIQYFDVAEDDDEWWVFTCEHLQCRPQMTKRALPLALVSSWKKAKRL